MQISSKLLPKATKVKFEKIKIVYWSFWPIFLGFLFGGYFLMPKLNDQSHLSVIPSNVDAVILLNPMAIFSAYEKLLEEDPIALSELQSEQGGGTEMEPRVGINPLKKVAIAHYQCDEQNEGFVVIVELTNFNQFVKTANQRDNKPDAVDYKEGKYILVDKDDQIFFKKGLVGLLYQAQKGQVSEDLAKQIFNDFYINEDKLISKEGSFVEAVNSTDQINYWSVNSAKVLENINPELSLINELFNRKLVHLNIAENGFNTNASLELTKMDAILERENEPLELIGNECFRFAASVNPKDFSNFFDLVLSEDKRYLVQDWTGGISASIGGFKDIELKKVHVTQSTDPLYPFNYDTVGVFSTGISNFASKLEGQFSYPFFNVACEVSQIKELKALINADSTISNVGEYYSYVLKDMFIEKKIPSGLFGNEIVLEPQRIFFYFVDNSIVFSPELPEHEFQPQYSTFEMLLSVPKFSETYVPKTMLDDIVISQLSDFDFGEYRLSFKEIKEGHLYMVGNFNLVNTSNHFVGFPLLIKKLGSIASLPLL